jgi:hypothetical protein
VAVIAAVGLVVGSTASNAQPNAEYSEFQGLSQEELETLHMKFTYVGGSFNVPLSHVYTASGTVPDMPLFDPCGRPEFDYVSDGFDPVHFTATTQELQAAIDSVATLPQITAGDVDSLGYLSFSLLYVKGGSTKCFEAVVDEENGRELFLKLREAFAGNLDVVDDLTHLACANGMLQALAPADVTEDVHLRFSAIEEENASEVFVGRVTVTNVSSATLPATMILVVKPKNQTVDLLNADDRTCQLAPLRAQFIELPVPADGLLVDESVEVELRFSNPSRRPIELYWQRRDGKRVTPKVYAGPGDR